MADNNEIYEAIRQADAAGDTESVNRLRSYLDTMPKHAPAEKPYQPTSSFIPGLIGSGAATFGGGKALEANAPKIAEAFTPNPAKTFATPEVVGDRVTQNLMSAAQDIKPTAPTAPPVNPTIAPQAGEYFSPYGAGQGAVKNATHNVDQILKNAVDQAALETKGFTAPGNSLILQPTDVANQTAKDQAAKQAEQEWAMKRAARDAAREAAVGAQEAGAAAGATRAERLAKAASLKDTPINAIKQAIAESKLGQLASSPAVEAAGKVAKGVTGLPYANLALRAVGGFGAGVGAHDAYQRAKQGQYIRGLISGLGAAGDVASMTRIPQAMIIGGAAGIAAPVANSYLDEFAKSHPKFAKFVHLRKGGLAHLAGGKSTSDLPEITGSENAVWDVKNNLDQALAKGINLSDPNYTKGVKEINASMPDVGEGALGLYHWQEPSKVYVAPYMTGPHQGAQVLGHEAQHSQEHDADIAKRNDSKNDSFLQALERQSAGAGASDTRKAIEENFQKFMQGVDRESKYSSDLGGYANSRHVPSDERFADFAGVEAALPRGQRFADTKVGKAVLQTPEQLNYYYQTVRPLEPKMMAQDEDKRSGFLKAMQKMRDAAEVNKHSDQSYANSALDILKTLFEK